MTHSKILLFLVLEEPNFKIYTESDTPSGDASLLRGHGAAAELSVQHDGAGSTSEVSVFNSTEIVPCSGEAASSRPEPNLSIITTQANALSGSQHMSLYLSCTSQSSVSGSQVSASGSHASASGISCDLCGQIVKNQAYLSQHRNKKKCLEKQRIQRQTKSNLRHPLRAWKHLECLKVILVESMHPR